MSDVEPFKSGEVSRFQSPSQIEKVKEDTTKDVIVNEVEDRGEKDEKKTEGNVEGKIGVDIAEKKSNTVIEPVKENVSKPTKKEKKDVIIHKEKPKTISSNPRIGGTMLSEEDRDVLTHLVLTLGGYTLIQGKAARNVDILVTGRSARSIKVILPSLLYP